ncbi:MAG: 1-acyl-sn-glycerol-3-phosphate acyltransferase [Alphaproteobacteria bacterium]|nr:1-acyl-sn-glycerol-3-phosphate acyltransferase [Alphaproteobacteria bacterium]
MKTIGFWRWLIWRVMWTVYGVFFAIPFRQRSLGLSWPRPKGPYLLLGNHSSTLDPAMTAWPIWHPIHFMASAALFRIPGLSQLISALGAFPKQKFVKDRGSVGKLVRLYKQGEIIVMYPEGTRTWDGRQIPIRPGTGRLVQKLGARVMICRNLTGWMLHPRWATYMRFVPLILEYEGPIEFPKGMSAADINDELQRLITIDTEREVPGLCLGWRTAHGLPEYLWACPSCFAVEGLQLIPGRGNHVRCGGCAAQWKVCVKGTLRSETEGVPDFRIAAAYDRIEAHFGDPPVFDPERLEAEGVVWSAPDASVRALPRDAPSTELARGSLRLTREGLEIHDLEGTVTWSMPFSALQASSMEVRSTLNLISADGYFRLVPGGQSTMMWSHLIRHWWWRSDPERRGPVPPP